MENKKLKKVCVVGQYNIFLEGSTRNVRNYLTNAKKNGNLKEQKEVK